MPSSAVRNFTDPDDYAATIRQARVELTVTGRGHFAAQLIRIDLHRLWMQRFSESLPRIVHGTGLGGRAVITFRTNSGSSVSCNGVNLLPTNVIRCMESGGSHQYSSGATALGSMSLALEDMAFVGSPIAGCDLAPPRDTQIVTPSRSAIAKLKRLHAAAGHLAENAPEVIAHPEASRGLEHALIEAMVSCLTAADTGEERAALRRHELIMRRFHTMIEEHPEEPLYIPEICKAIGIAERTLRTCCKEHLGVSPKHYLLTRRMQLARRDLRRADATATTVTQVASRYGFWQFGDFAGAYKSLFGELPSTTLARAPE
jgi:AraC-like DNA-binding protein